MQLSWPGGFTGRQRGDGGEKHRHEQWMDENNEISTSARPCGLRSTEQHVSHRKKTVFQVCLQFREGVAWVSSPARNHSRLSTIYHWKGGQEAVPLGRRCVAVTELPK